MKELSKFSQLGKMGQLGKLSRFISLLALCIATSAGFVGCSKDEKPKPEDASISRFDRRLQAITGLQVLNAEGKPVVGAQILIGSAQNVPFEGNHGVTDDSGEMALPAGWTQPEMVTIDAPGYLRVTYMALEPSARSFVLKKKFESQVELKGVTSGHPVRHKDGYIDYTLVMSAMTRQDLLNFQIHKVLSPVNDEISAVGQEMQIPSNVSLPKQTENYFIGITLNKPSYRLFFPESGVQRVFAARGRFLFKPVVDGLRGDTQIFQLINHFTITGGSIRDVNLKEAQTKLDIPVMDLTFTDKKAFKAPTLEKGQVLVVLPVADNNGYLIPTDIKRLTSNQAKDLSIWKENPSYLAQVLKNQNEFESSKPGMDRLSATFLPFEENMQSEFLPLIKNPVANSKYSFSIPAVETSSLNRLVTYAVISDVKTSKNPDGSVKKTPVQAWEVYAPSWVTEINLPQWEWAKSAPTTRFEVSLVGSINQDATAPVGPELMEKATHVTRSSLDF